MAFALAACIGLAAAASPALAAPPGLNTVSPRGIQRGKTETLTLSGTGIGLANPTVITSLPGTLGPVKAEAASKITVPVTVPADAPVGLYPIQVRTGDGLTTRELVAVGDLPELAEKEPNDERAAAQEVTLPVTVQGMCGGTDRDHYRFSGKKGEGVVVELEARRMGSGLDPVLVIYDAAGHELASEVEATRMGGDMRLVFALPADGGYVVEVNDIRYSGGGDPFYRLKLGTYACAEAVFPLGWKRGEPLEALFLGGNLPSPIRAKITPPSDPDLAWMTISLPASPVAITPFRLVLGNAPEALEPDAPGVHDWSLDAVMNGRITAPGEVDRYKVATKPGQTIVFDVDAAQLGSRLDCVLKVMKPDGAVLAETDDSQGFDPQLTLAIPEGATELHVSIEDLLGRGGAAYSYRLKARPAGSDYTLSVAAPAITIPRGAATVVPVNVGRQNFNDAIQLSIPSDVPGVTASGGLIPAGAAKGEIILSATPGAELRTVPLEIWGEAGPATQPVRRKARLDGDGTPQGPARPFELAAAIGNGPPITLSLSASTLTLVHGQGASLVIKATRTPEHKDLVAIATAGLPAQVSGGTGTIASDSKEITIKFDVDSLAPLGPATLMITGKTKAAGREETIVLPPIKATVERPYAFEVLTPNVTLAAGGKATITGVIRRVAPFNDAVKVAHEGSLPAGVTMSEAKIEPASALVQIEVTAGADAKPGGFDVPLRASTPMAGRKQTKDYVIPDIPLHVTITAAPAAPAPK